MTNNDNVNVLSCRPPAATYRALMDEAGKIGLSRSTMLRLILAERYSLPDEFAQRQKDKVTK